MQFIKKSDGIIMSKTNNLDFLSCALNGFIMIHKKENIIGFTNSLNNMYLTSNDDDYNGISKFFNQKEDYDLYIVKNKKLIKNPNESDIIEVEEKRHFVLFSKIAKRLLDMGYKKVQEYII